MARIDRNGYSPSILFSVDGICFLCNDEADTVRHEIIGGASRQISKREGFWVALCVPHHEMVHRDAKLAERALKRPCQARYLETHTRDEWLKLIGRFYE